MRAIINRVTLRRTDRDISADRAFGGGVLSAAIALAMLLFLSPLMIAVALLVYLEDGGPILFGHERIGHGGRRFKVLKFRTMVVDAEARLERLLAADPQVRREWNRFHKLQNDPRITTIGRFLRKSSLDELPQLFNVVRGDMSFVGPRPIVDAEICKYGRFYTEYCSRRPGITGLWQASGRNDTSYRRRVAMDVLYSRRASPMLDLRIVLMTVPAVLKAKGSY